MMGSGVMCAIQIQQSAGETERKKKERESEMKKREEREREPQDLEGDVSRGLESVLRLAE